MTEESGSINLKELSKRAFSYFGGLSKNEVKRLVNYAMIIESANGNLKGALTTMSTKLKEALDEIENQKLIANGFKTTNEELESHISVLNARLEEKQAEIDSITRNSDLYLIALRYIKEAAGEFV